VLTADSDELVKRVLNRANESGRSDDTEDVIRRRLQIYADQTEPLLDVYAGRGVLVLVNGMGEISEVTDRVLTALAD
jgi:adenylate kinase